MNTYLKIETLDTIPLQGIVHAYADVYMNASECPPALFPIGRKSTTNPALTNQRTLASILRQSAPHHLYFSHGILLVATVAVPPHYTVQLTLQ